MQAYPHCVHKWHKSRSLSNHETTWTYNFYQNRVKILSFTLVCRFRTRMDLLSMLNGAWSPWSEGSHILVKESSTCSSVSTTTLKVVPSILHNNQIIRLWTIVLYSFISMQLSINSWKSSLNHCIRCIWDHDLCGVNIWFWKINRRIKNARVMETEYYVSNFPLVPALPASLQFRSQNLLTR